MAKFDARCEVQKKLNTIANSYPKKKDEDKEALLYGIRHADSLYKCMANYTSKKVESNLVKSAIISGVWQHYLYAKNLTNIDAFFAEVKPSKRKDDIYRVNRATGGQSSKEEMQCYWIEKEVHVIDGISFCDHQIPLKTRKCDVTNAEYDNLKSLNKGKGKVDLIGYKDSDIIFVEYKIPFSTEPLLRAVLEVLTYYYQASGNDASNSSYISEFNSVFGTAVKNIKCAIVVPREMYYIAHKVAYELIEKFDIACYTFASDDYKDIVRLTPDEIKEYRELSRVNTLAFEDEEITALIVNTLDELLQLDDAL